MNESFPNLRQFFILITAFFIVGGFSSAKSQEINKQVAGTIPMLQNYTDALYGTDDVLVNGRAYLPDHYNANGHPYFLTQNWTKSTLIIDGKSYENQEILYNIDLEILILKTTINDGNKVLLMLNTEFIDAFYLGSHSFINASKYLLENKFPGFVEQVYSGSFSVFIRHQKAFVFEYTKNNPYGFYTSTKSENYIRVDNELVKLSSKKSLIEYFPDYKKDIKSFLRKNKIRYKHADNDQLHKLFEYCDQISSK